MPLDEMTSHVRALLVVLNYPERIGRFKDSRLVSIEILDFFKHWHMYFQSILRVIRCVPVSTSCCHPFE